MGIFLTVFGAFLCILALYVFAIMPRITGGYMVVALSELLGLNNLGFRKAIPNDISKSSICILINDNIRESQVDSILEKYAGKEDYILNFSTKSDETKIPESDLIQKYNLVTQHAYCIKGYDPDKKIVKILNPHCSANIIEVPLQIFAKSIQSITITSLE